MHIELVPAQNLVELHNVLCEKDTIYMNEWESILYASNHSSTVPLIHIACSCKPMHVIGIRCS